MCFAEKEERQKGNAYKRKFSVYQLQTSQKFSIKNIKLFCIIFNFKTYKYMKYLYNKIQKF